MPYRSGGEDRACGSLLRVEDVAAQPGLNFLSDGAAEYARDRVVAVNAEGGSAEPGRLMHNMLSSMPLCFSIFGELRSRPDLGVGVVRQIFDAAAASVEMVECEWKPAGAMLGDRTAFDAVLITVHDDGSRHMIGVETKYTEPFSQRAYHSARYDEVHDASGWFRPGTAANLRPARTNQLWRNLLLAAAIEQEGEIATTRVAVLALEDDDRARDAVEGVRTALIPEQADRCRFVALEDLAAVVSSEHSPEWAERFRRRYLDVDAVAH